MSDLEKVMNQNLLSDLRDKVNRQHQEALAACDVLEKYLLNTDLPHEEAAPNQPGRHRAAKETESTKTKKIIRRKGLRSSVLHLIRDAWLTTREITQRLDDPNITPTNVSTCLSGQDIKDKIRRRPRGNGFLEYRYVDSSTQEEEVPPPSGNNHEEAPHESIY